MNTEMETLLVCVVNIVVISEVLKPLMGMSEK